MRLRAHLTEMMAVARVKNDNETLIEQQTAALRGRIKCLRSLIELGDDRPVTGDQQPPQGACLTEQHQMAEKDAVAKPVSDAAADDDAREQAEFGAGFAGDKSTEKPTAAPHPPNDRPAWRSCSRR